MTDRTKILSLSCILVMALAIAWFSLRTPLPLDKYAPAGDFAAGRALEDIQVLAGQPHPVESRANQKVRDVLLARLHGLGLATEIQRVAAAPAWGRWSKRAKTHTIENIVARLPGRDAGLPALLLISHYDSVPKSPGAADDMAGVASMLEITRLLRHTGPTARDVIFLFSDGEEAGLVGARAFAEHHPLISRIGFVINLESRGGGGRALMFETGPDNGAAVRLFARVANLPSSNSLAAYIYKILPNDTDFTVLRHRGIAGLNFAFIGRPELYHAPEATADRVEPGAIQSMGAQIWAVTRAIAYATSFAPKAADLAWFDLYGRMVIVYPFWFGWAPILLAIICSAALYARLPPVLRTRDIWSGTVRTLAALLLGIILLLITGLIGVGNYRHALYANNFTTMASSAVLLGVSLITFNALRTEAPSPARGLGTVVVAIFMALLLQLIAPATAPVAAWAAFIAVAVTLSATIGALVPAAVLAAFGLGFVFQFWYLFMLGIGITLPPAVALLLPLACAISAPWLHFSHSRRARQAGVLCLAIALAIAIVARIAV